MDIMAVRTWRWHLLQRLILIKVDLLHFRPRYIELHTLIFIDGLECKEIRGGVHRNLNVRSSGVSAERCLIRLLRWHEPRLVNKMLRRSLLSLLLVRVDLCRPRHRFLRCCVNGVMSTGLFLFSMKSRLGLEGRVVYWRVIN